MLRTHYRKGLIALATLLLSLALSACSANALSSQIEQISSADAQSAALDALSGRLLILGADGNIAVSDPSGDNRIAITDAAASGVSYQQPTWSPDGALIAWTEVDASGDDAEGDATIRLVTSSADGAARIDLEAPFPPFYIYWSPDSHRLAYLSNWNRSENLSSMALRLVEIETNDGGERKLKASTLAEGQPFYFSWAPDGERMLTHIGDERVDLRSIDGGSESLFASSGAFAAPQWSPDGAQLVFAVDEGDLQKLIITDTAGNRIDEITDYENRITFSLSPDSGPDRGQLAYVVTGGNSIGTAALGPLYVVDLATKATREISGQPVIAFFWSPDGEKLAYLTLERAGDAVRSRWRVWDGKQSRAYDSVLPSAQFMQRYLTFFDQYAQSMRIWSPDSRAFTYAGANEDGLSGVWVQLFDEEKPVRVGRGDFVAWSPVE